MELDLHCVPRLIVAPLVDPVVDLLGFPAESPYVEYCWLPVMGPTATWLYRRLAGPLYGGVSELDVDLLELSASLGVGDSLSRHGRLARAFQRLIRYGAADWGGTRLLVRRALAPLTVAQLGRLPEVTRRHHEMFAGEHAASR